ncbi:Frag1/DRAM/Sfk1, partial [Hysterangium stoloniferum]
LLAMLIVWAVDGKPKYVSQDGNIPFISDIGASKIKPLFIAVCSVTAACFAVSLVLERWLRHARRLLPDMRRRERLFSRLAIAGATLGGIGLVLLSVFDTVRHVKLHRVFLLVFMIGVTLSAIFTVLEFRWLNKDYGGMKRLRLAYIAKGTTVLVLVALSIAFGACLDNKIDVAAVLEWLIGFGFTFYLLTFVFDLSGVDTEVDEGNQILWVRGQPMVALRVEH